MRKVLFAVLIAALATAVPIQADLNVSQRSSPVNDYQSALAVGPGSPSIITSSAASSTKLMGVDVWSTVPYKALIYTVTNGTQSTNPVAVGGGAAFGSLQWRTPDPAFVVLGSSGGTDAYRVIVTNLDASSTADFYISFHYSL